jgi:DNA-binding response OmpR family regulator
VPIKNVSFKIFMSEFPKRILCVEDNRDSREMMKEMLQLADPSYSVAGVETAAEALDISARQTFDLYVLDIWLPGMDGMGLCRRLRERKVTAPIIFFSAMVRPQDKEYGLAAGADEFLVKPADIERFPDTVRRLLSSRAKSESAA